MNPILGRAVKSVAPVVIVSMVLLASYLASPVNRGAFAGVICTYVNPIPTVTSVSPNNGTTYGGTTVTINGTDFCNGTVTVKFGLTAAASATVNSNTQITAVSPAHVAGVVDVTVTTAGGTSPTSTADHYTFHAVPCTGANLSAAPPSPQASGTTVTLTASAVGCPDPLYQFWGLAPGSSTWTIIQAYSTTNTAGGPLTPVGTYHFSVWVKDKSSSGTNTNSLGSYDAFRVITYDITAAACTGAGLTPNKASPQQSGTIITFTATSTGCSNPEYLFYVQATGGPWILGRGYGGPTYVWNTAGNGVTSYNVDVWVREIGSGVSQQDFHLISYTLSAPLPCAAGGISANKTSPQPTGTTITFTGTATTCSQPVFLYYVQAAGGPWIIGRNFSVDPNYAWVTTGNGKTTYTIVVWVHQNGVTGAPHQTFASMSFTLN